MINVLKKERFILSVYLFLFLWTCSILLLFNKVQIHLFINQNHSENFDTIFKFLTLLGEGLFVLCICFGLLFLRYRFALVQVLAFAFSGLAAQFLKRFVFADALRPRAYFDNLPEYSLRFVEGVDVANFYSFPSGHTTTAFAFFMLFAFISERKGLKLLFIVIAAMVGYSRMYLSQHFLVDVVFGSLLGVISALLFHWLVMGIKKPALDLSARNHLNFLYAKRP
jgi:membrane-associated phospholipid phosphatase